MTKGTGPFVISRGCPLCYREDMASELTIEFLEIHDNELVVEGRVHTSLPVKVPKVVFRSVINDIEAAVSELANAATHAERTFIFEAHLPVGKFRPLLGQVGLQEFPNVKRGKFCPVTDVPHSYYYADGHAVTLQQNQTLEFAQRGDKWLEERERSFQASLIKNNHANQQDIALRQRALQQRRHSADKAIWLISDRPNLAGDNGEALFKYLTKNPPANVQVYYVLEADSQDFERLSAIGDVLEYWSDEHKLALLQATNNISSCADEFVINPFEGKRKAFADLLRANFVFLQHGITQNDVSHWLNRWNKNIKLFTTAAEGETRSILDNPLCGYSASIVKRTGFARHDTLLAQDAQRKQEGRTPRHVLIAPTWRSWLRGGRRANSSAYPPFKGFTESEYYRFYQALINDADIKAAADTQNLTVRFLIHPTLIQEAQQFTSDFAQVVTTYDYAHEFLDAAVLMTDYSSVAFDFALLRKPIIYAQFDEQTFFGTQWGRGYFNCREQGFGPVCTTLQETKDALLGAIENPTMPTLYQQRVDAFFGEVDSHACERIAALIQGIR